MADKLPGIALFCDEAGKESDRFLAVGGLIVTAEDVPEIRAEFARRLKALDIKSEAKWNNTKKGTLLKYQSLIHWTFGLIELRQLLFHCLVVDFDRFDHNLRPDGGKNESLKRMYFQLILHRLGKKHGKSYRLFAFPDKANELEGLDGLKRGLNSVLGSKYGCTDSPIKAIEFRESHKEPMLQLNDLILGAVCAQKNRRYEAEDAGQPKANLAGFVLGRSKLLNYDVDTPRGADAFSIWNLKSAYLRGGS